MMSTTPVRTFARIRPALSRELHDDTRRLHRCLAQQPEQPVVHVATKPGAPVIVEEDGSCASPDVKTFELDGVFDEAATTESVYDQAGAPQVECVLRGVNATIFAYGMTGSGKSYTMLGQGDTPGVVGLAARDLLSAAAAAPDMLTVEVGFMQLYGTLATDLLVENSVKLKIRHRGDEVAVEGQSRRRVSTPADVAAVVAEGVARRKVCSQKLNSASSRSHAALTFFVTSTEISPPHETENRTVTANHAADDDAEAESVSVRTSKLVCVDLAGSERVKESGVQGVGLKEAQAINLSLFHLIRVVQASGLTRTLTHTLTQPLSLPCPTTAPPSMGHVHLSTGASSCTDERRPYVWPYV